MLRSLVTACVLFWSIPAALHGQPVQQMEEKDYLPYRKHAELPGKVIGLMVQKGQPILSTEGRSGPPDQVCFSGDGNSYRWVYVPTFGNPRITNLKVPVGNKGEVDVYPSLDMANLEILGRWGIRTPITLVEVEVNQGKGSPGIDSFVGTNYRVLEGTKEYPLQAEKVVRDAEKRFDAFRKDNAGKFEKALKKVGARALAGKEPTGPRVAEKLMFVTWHSGKNVLEVRFRGTLRDGAFRMIEGGGIGNPRPLPLPLPPVPRKGVRPLPPAPGKMTGRVGDREEFVAFPPPPPPRFKIRVGTGYGIHFGCAYEFDRTGALQGTRELPVLEFVEPEHPVPGGPRGLPVPVPPRP